MLEMKWVFEILWEEVLSVLYRVILLLVFRGNIWALYTSYHDKGKARWKKLVWNTYMRRNAASISIDAKIASPLVLPHGVSGIFITQSATIGHNVVVFQQVTIGANTLEDSKSYGAPTIGDNVYIGAGAKIIGSAIIENNVRIGANAVVTTHVPENSTIICANTRVVLSDTPKDNTFCPHLKKTNSQSR